jgi:hypothetical protein
MEYIVKYSFLTQITLGNGGTTLDPEPQKIGLDISKPIIEFGYGVIDINDNIFSYKMLNVDGKVLDSLKLTSRNSKKLEIF